MNTDKTLMQLVSYPRTGSHWTRMILEEYLGKYCLPTSFYGCNEHWGFHLHDRVVGAGDEGITSGFEKVIYLYRNPVDVVYSLLMYEGWGFERRKEIVEEYKTHLQRWTVDNSDIESIIYIKYEDIKTTPILSFKKIIKFLGEEFDEERLTKIYNKSTMKNLAKSIADKNVIHKNHFVGTYDAERELFKNKFGNEIMKEFKTLWL